ncbi:MAG: DinB family protein [Anaerolineales bacterium]|jgi:hypothetical protein
MSNDQVVREQMLFLLGGGNAHLTFDQAVADFPLEAINSHPPNVDYTPWHLLEHIRIAQWDILEFSRDPGHVSPEWPEGYWPNPEAQADQAQWEETILSFRRDLKALQEIIKDPSTDLYSDLPHAPGYNILREILLVADHNAYHIGELAILRQVMGLWPSGSP